MIESRKVELPGATGVRLAARLDLPEEPHGFALFAHCFTCGKDIFAASRIASGLAARNIAVLRFDFTGIGSSEGEFANTNFSSNVSDLVAAANYLRQNHGPPSLLIGHSLGGAAVLAAARGEFQRRKRVGAYSPTYCSGSSPGAKNHDFTHYCRGSGIRHPKPPRNPRSDKPIKPPQCWVNRPQTDLRPDDVWPQRRTHGVNGSRT